ncbi:hypothetical protein A2810_02695 [candidate division Kazan bacterium RIFCSPHIGHO2_01_FULL_49_10]|uniref:Homing endonuclease LAGLIDADG domain-containing protein n=1 Tax=candidate division Kazan bacterium RIFCSPLOWO2_01_FULL_48_13 TaxID=1798539 RepID=A0A1F4PPX3_UNCK3|nr:MAG: hypothetical protein A2810_02695 [candidate division Kazan bacterium RIFCSPHIGHO2_01_FULL_49_10]OGB85731.1 MAG: hypothetical protein A2994_03180 [candidate division Kazan bacterium RIFCSPLOWO2_01_FULL_48_13]
MNGGNTVGSLSSAQHAILVGTLLGDGTLRRQGTRIDALLEVNHSFKYREYVDWKWQHFRLYVLTPPKTRPGNGSRVAYRFTTQSIPTITSYYNWFYGSGKKSVPSNLELDPLSLAVWFMDDGSKIRSAFYLNTQQFSMAEQQLLQTILWRTFRIKSLLNRDKKYWRIRVSTDSTKTMLEIIKPHILPCFRYKLCMTP